MGIVAWIGVAWDNDGWRRATREALILLGKWDHRKRRTEREKKRSL
jgi:hypothetical protein